MTAPTHATATAPGTATATGTAAGTDTATAATATGTGTASTGAADPYGHRVALGATGMLGAFNLAGVLAPADVHVATRLGRLGAEPDEQVLLALALAVRGVRVGSVCVELATLSRTVLGESDDPEPVAELPWPDPGRWRAACARSPLVTVGPDGRGGRPARLVGGRLYLERYWRQEEQVRAELQRRAAPVTGVDTERLRDGMAHYFPDDDTQPGRQRLAAAVSALRQVSVLAGGPGTGKTTTIARLLALLAASTPADRPYPRIALAAPTGKAAARLEEAVREQVGTLGRADAERLGGLRASTLHRLLGTLPGGGFRHDRSNRLPFDAVVVDETSMVSLTLMARLLDALRPDTRLVLVGDPDQLASVEAGAVLGDVTRAGGVAEPALTEALRAVDVAGGEQVVNGVVTLQHTYRFGGGIAELARAIQSGDADAAVHVLRVGHPDVRYLADADGVTSGLPGELHAIVDASAQELTDAAAAGDAAAALRALEVHRVLCAHRVGPFGAAWWGAAIEQRLARLAPVPAPQWYVGRPVLVTANDYDTGLYNGDTGVVVHTADGPRVAFARGDAPVLIAPARLSHILTVHAMTVHRAQGSQFAEVTVVLPPPESPLLTRELLYTAVTRARTGVRVIGSEAAVRAAVARPVNRASGLRHRLGVQS